MDYNHSKKILFAGDMYCKSRSIEISSNMTDIFRRHDFSVINLEAPLLKCQNFLNSNQKSGPIICQGEKTLDIIKKLRINLVGGANNHMMDAGIDGLRQTIEITRQNSIEHIGFGMSSDDAGAAFRIVNAEIIIIGVGEEEFGVADNVMPGINSMYNDTVIDQIKKNKDKYFIIVYAHGGPEREPLPSSYIVRRYRQFIDSGAKLVVGHHPHVAQGYEEYHGGHIFYSLGNFYHEMSAQNVGILLSVEIMEGKLKKFTLLPIECRDGQLSILEDDEDFRFYINLCNVVLSDENLFKRIHQEQAIRMYDEYYQNYFMSLFSYRFSRLSRIKLMLERFVGNYKGKLLSMQKSSQNLLLNLLRNRSHHEFIETALKLKLGEIVDLRDSESSKLYEKLKNLIRYE